MTVPPAVLSAVTKLMGATPSSWRPVESGYTAALRLIARCDDGRSVFVKAATDARTQRALIEEWAFYSQVDAPFMPAVIGFDDGPPSVLLLEDLSSAKWPPPWTPEQISRVRATLEELWNVPAPVGLAQLDRTDQSMLGWPLVAVNPEPFLSLGLVSAAWLASCLNELLRAENMADVSGTSLLHTDIRSDNLCFAGKRTILIDWDNACIGRPEVDLVAWLPSLALETGRPPESFAMIENPLIAWAAGYFAARAGLAPPLNAAGVRRIQLLQLTIALPWACRALGLPSPDGANRQLTEAP